MFKKVLKFLFFILLAVNFQEVFATSDQTYTLIKGYAGSSNRIRKYDQFVYTYDQQKGFFCRPESVKGSLYTIEDTSTPKTSPIKFYSSGSANILDSIKDFGDKLLQRLVSLLYNLVDKPGTLPATIGAELIDVLLTPVMCTGIITTYAKAGLGGGTIIALLLQVLNTFLGTAIYEYLGGNDYGIDMKNPHCTAITSVMLASCVTYFMLNKTRGPFDKVTLIAYCILAGVYLFVKLIQGNIQEARAIDNYNKLNLCGDDWYTFGNAELMTGTTLVKDGDQAKFPGLTNLKNTKNDNLTGTVFSYYPTKSTSLPGSYKFMIEGCIEEIQSAGNSSDSNSSAGYCSLIGINKKDYIVNGKSILSINNKIYREKEYGGVEIMFETNNSDDNFFDNCYDPRPEAANYDIYAFIPQKKDRRQTYYARGMDGLNFACERWQDKEAYRSAFECCVQASKRFVCVNYHSPNSKNGMENIFLAQNSSQTRYKNYYRVSNNIKYENVNMFCDINKTSCKISKKTLEQENSNNLNINFDKSANCDMANYRTGNEKSTLENIFVEKNFRIIGDNEAQILKMIVMGNTKNDSIEKADYDTFKNKVASINDLVKFYLKKYDETKDNDLNNFYNEKSSVTNAQIAAIRYAKTHECTEPDYENHDVCKCLARLKDNVPEDQLKDKYEELSNSGNSDDIICSSILNGVCSVAIDSYNSIRTATGKTAGPLGIELKLSPSEIDGNTKYCIKTQSFCPFDFNIAGGTEKVGNQFRKKLTLKKSNPTLEQTDCLTKDSNGQCKTKTFGLCQIQDAQSGEIIEYLDCNNRDSNFCQFQRHCQLVNEYVVLDEKIPDNPYLDKACINFVGSSKLNANYAPYYSYKPVKNPLYGHFTAPIIECIVETAKNQLYNKAGRTICNNPNEVPNDDPDISLEKDICTTGVRYRKGDTILGDNANIFHNLRKKLRRLYLVLLTLSIVCYALKVVTFNHETSFPELTKHLFKIVFVISFSYNSQWVNIALNSVFDLTDTVILSTIKFMRIDSLMPSYTNSSFDGCYFASDPFYTEDKNARQNNELPESQWTPYESGRGYIALLDMIDCKLRLYLGMTVTNSALSILLICILIVLTGSIIMVLILPLILILVSIFLLAMKVAYMLMVTLLSIVILLFVAPVIIPMILFDKTKTIFDKWLSSIIGFVFYTMFFVIAITLVFSFISTVFLNGARFTGTQNAPFRNLYCGHTCKLTLGTRTIDTMINDTDKEIENCKNQGGEVTDLRSESLFCFLNTSHSEVNKGGGFLDFIVPNLNLRMLDVKTIKNSWSLLFSQGLIILLIFVMADEILSAVLKLGSNIFGVAVSDDLIPSIAEAMGKITKSIGDKFFNNPAFNLLKAGVYKAGEGISKIRKGGKIERPAPQSKVTVDIDSGDGEK